MPVTVIEIDEKSLAKIGQWPWPRTVTAELLDTISRYRPAAIALDIFMPEADALSPERLLARVGNSDAELARALARLPSNDTVLARALAGCGRRARAGRHARADRHDAACPALPRARNARQCGAGDARSPPV